MCGGWKKKKWSVYYHEFIVCKFPTNFGHHIDYICWLMLGRAWEWTWNRKTWLWIWMHFLAALTTLFFPPTITWCHSNAYWPRALTSADKNVYHIKKSKFWTNTKFNYGLQRKKTLPAGKNDTKNCKSAPPNWMLAGLFNRIHLKRISIEFKWLRCWAHLIYTNLFELVFI